MVNNFISLFFLFFKIGIFTVGGGYAMIPLIQQELVVRGLLTIRESIDLIAIAEMTPGPFGINAATFAGTKLYGVPGAVVTTLGIALPSFIICLVIARFFFNINNKPQVQAVLLGIRPVVLALIASALIAIARSTLFPNDALRYFQWPVLLIAAGVSVCLLKTKISPILLIAVSGIIGIVFLH